MSNDNVYQRLNKIMKEVKYVQKDSRVQGQYAAVSHDQVTATLHDVFVDNGVMLIPSQVKSNVEDSGGRTKNGTIIIRYEADYDIKVVNIDNPADFFTVKINAHANDMGDKAPGKALSYACKCVMLKILMLESGENEESRVEGQRLQNEKINENQVKWINDKIKEFGIDEVGFKNHLAKYRCNEIEDITVPLFPIIEKAINSKNPKNPTPEEIEEAKNAE